jgi:hypothetical protein
MTRRARSSEELLREFADGDVSGIESLTHAKRERAILALDADAIYAAEIAALAAVDAPPNSWLLHLEAGASTVDIDRVVGALVAVAAIVGTPRVVSAAGNILSATDRVDEFGD